MSLVHVILHTHTTGSPIPFPPTIHSLSLQDLFVQGDQLLTVSLFLALLLLKSNEKVTEGLISMNIRQISVATPTETMETALVYMYFYSGH